MNATEGIVDLDDVVMQAWKKEGIEAPPRKVEKRLAEERQVQIRRYRLEGKKAYAWGYLTRKSLLTPVGDLAGCARSPGFRDAGPLSRRMGLYLLISANP